MMRKLPQKKIMEQLNKKTNDIMILTEVDKKNVEASEKLMLLGHLAKTHHVKLSDEIVKAASKMKLKIKLKTILVIE